jgi:hypothetical protein
MHLSSRSFPRAHASCAARKACALHLMKDKAQWFAEGLENQI